MGKGKGRASAKNALHWEIQQEVRKVYNSSTSGNNRTTENSDDRRQRPRLKVGLGQLRNLLRERQSYEKYEWMQQRRRAGFLLNEDQRSLTQVKSQEVVPTKALGSLLFSPSQYMSHFEGSPTPSLQTSCLGILGEYIIQYLDAMGIEELHAALSLLPSEALAVLSVAVSRATGVDNRLAYALGRHPHVEALCFRAPRDIATNEERSLSDRGLIDLIPDTPCSTTEINTLWEDMDEDNDDGLSKLVEASMFRLKRLELVDCPSLTATGILAFLEKCPFITHLSLAGCLNRNEGGIEVMHALPTLLPALKVLDVTRCSWATSALIKDIIRVYENIQQIPPAVHFQRVVDLRGDW